MVDGPNSNGRKFDLNQMIEHYFIRLASRGMIVIGFPLAVWGVNTAWNSFDAQLTTIQESINSVIDDVDEIEFKVRTITDEHDNFKLNHLTPFTHLKEHRDKKDWFDATEEE